MYIGEFEIESPLINGGGLVKNTEDVRRMAATGVGAVLFGSVTLEPRIGNSPNGETVDYQDPETGITYNSLGMPNAGLKVIAPQLPEMIKIAHDNGKPFILNFAPVTDNPVQEITRAFELLEHHGVTLDGFELNASCPNVVVDGGKRHDILSAHPGLFSEVLFEISDIRANEVPIGTILTRISPFTERRSIPQVVGALDGTADVVVGFNTFPGGHPVKIDNSDILQVPGGVGGQSGRGMSVRAEEQTRFLIDARDELDIAVEIIGSNGVVDAESMKRRMDLGVSAVSATTLFWRGNWAQAADKLLREYAELVG